MNAHHELSLPSGPAAASVARAHLRLIGAAWDDDVRNTVLLLASEMATNAVRHGHPPLALHVTESADGLRMQVSDAGTAPLTQPAGGWRMPPRRAVGGRGLPLLQVLAAGWGSRLRIDPDGSTRHEVWCWVPR